VEQRTETFEGRAGRIAVRVWEGPAPTRIVVIAHGYGEHSGRYDHVARALVAGQAAVWCPDLEGHGASAGERAVVTDFEHAVDDLHQVTAMALDGHPGRPVVLLGHSMGGLIAARFAQRYGAELAGLALSGPLIGRYEFAAQLAALPEIPDIAIDPAALSRDPAVGEAYAADPLVYHGPFRRPMLLAIDRALAAVEAGPGLGGLPTLHLHGSDDTQCPLDVTRPGVERLRGSDFAERVYEGAHHEIFNETNRDEVIADVVAFVDRVTAPR
jgi:alpha-beta hydrolase superfamily lysophospholipase